MNKKKHSKSISLCKSLQKAAMLNVIGVSEWFGMFVVFSQLYFLYLLHDVMLGVSFVHIHLLWRYTLSSPVSACRVKGGS